MSRKPVVRLLNIEMVEGSVDSFSEETVAALFHLSWILSEVRAAAGEALCPDHLFAVDVAAG